MGRRLIPLVTQERFAEITCMEGNAFGVTSTCGPCDDYNFPACMRKSLREALAGNQTRAENFLGQDLSITYHEEELLWGGESRVQLSRRGISAVNVRPVFETILSEDISPYILEEIPITTEGSKKIITIPRFYVDNPAHITIREHGSSSVVKQDVSAVNYPRRTSTDWVIAIDLGNSAETEVDIQHCKYMQVTVPSFDEDDCEGEIFAAMPGTEDLIPFAKPPVSSGGNTTYWFYTWSLIDPAFLQDDTIDLLRAEFYKLVEQVDFLCMTEEEAFPIVLEEPSVCSEEFALGPNENLILTIIRDTVIDIRHSRSNCCSSKNPVRIKIFYKTDPALTEVDLANMEQAIVYLTAAELPNVACDCEIPKESFVGMAKTPYTNMHINPYNGDVYASQKYGNLHGQMVYAERISKEKRSYKVVVL